MQRPDNHFNPKPRQPTRSYPNQTQEPAAAAATLRGIPQGLFFEIFGCLDGNSSVKLIQSGECDHIVSDKDKNHPFLDDAKCFKYNDSLYA